MTANKESAITDHEGKGLNLSFPEFSWGHLHLVSWRALAAKSFFPTHTSLPFSNAIHVLPWWASPELCISPLCLGQLYANTMVGMSLVWVSLHSHNTGKGLMFCCVFQAGRHLASAVGLLSVDLLASLPKPYTCRCFPKVHVVGQMSDLSHLLRASGSVSVAPGLVFSLLFCLHTFLYGLFFIFYCICSVWALSTCHKACSGLAKCFTRVLFSGCSSCPLYSGPFSEAQALQAGCLSRDSVSKDAVLSRQVLAALYFGGEMQFLEGRYFCAEYVTCQVAVLSSLRLLEALKALQK